MCLPFNVHIFVLSLVYTRLLCVSCQWESTTDTRRLPYPILYRDHVQYQQRWTQYLQSREAVEEPRVSLIYSLFFYLIIFLFIKTISRCIVKYDTSISWISFNVLIPAENLGCLFGEAKISRIPVTGYQSQMVKVTWYLAGNCILVSKIILCLATFCA